MEEIDKLVEAARSDCDDNVLVDAFGKAAYVIFGEPLIETVVYREGHKNSKGEDAPWVIESHETGEILSSHPSKEAADEHLVQMRKFKHMKG